MIRYLHIMIIILTVNSCAVHKVNKNNKKNRSDYSISSKFLITKIDSTNSYYLVYCSKNKKSYKIISKKVDNRNALNKIELGKKYFFELNDFLQKTNNNPLTGFCSAVPCFFLDDETEICHEDGVLGPYKTQNLKGIFYKHPRSR